MSLTIDALGKISPWKEAWSIEAKILTIWEDARIVNENMQKLLHMVLMDKQMNMSSSTVIPNPSLSLTSMDQILQKRIDYEYLIDMNSLKRYQRPPAVILQSFKIKVNGGEELSMLDMSQYGIASHHFSRLRSNDVGDLVSDGQFFVVGKIKEIVEDPECYKIKILVEDRTSCGMFVLLDSAVTKLLGRTCSDVFLLLEDEMDRIEHQYYPQFFHQLIGKEIVFKVQAKRISTQGYCGTFKVINVISDARFFNKLHADQCIKDQICFLIGEIIDVLKHQKWWYCCCLCNAPVCHVGNVFYCYLCRVECVDAIRRYRIKIIVFHSNGSNIFILEDDESTDDYTIPNSMISQLMNKKIVFIVDPRPVEYELNISIHVVRAICDDIDIVKFLEDSTRDNQQQTVNHDFHARISSSQGSNLFGNHQPLTIREELRSAFGQCENTVEPVERMDKCSG
ncbi:uncharacterized protein LOC107647476 [Arachis ipaensis]|uniref:uncharacterized protein LOC107647476 n=1 Tax=Arachis ipaensis TaxID=130454 RepID=UPI0007AFD9B0|nr:uncharacterized protein LOC107647476 [Arachis ipaensis]